MGVRVRQRRAAKSEDGGAGAGVTRTDRGGVRVAAPNKWRAFMQNCQSRHFFRTGGSNSLALTGGPLLVCQVGLS